MIARRRGQRNMRSSSPLQKPIFNVATVAHGDEAVLAAAYLFTVHYFVNHWRPDKFPLDVVIFTGSMPLEEYKRDYTVEYNRLVKTGEFSSTWSTSRRGR